MKRKQASELELQEMLAYLDGLTSMAGRLLAVLEQWGLNDPEKMNAIQRVISMAAEYDVQTSEGQRREPTHSGPLTKEHRTWRGFADDMIRLEKRARDDHREPEKVVLYLHYGAPSARTIARTQQGYGVEPSHWPPSKYPEDWDPGLAREWHEPRSPKPATDK